ncbi:hypothetical protein [Pseudomonas graminis]
MEHDVLVTFLSLFSVKSAAANTPRAGKKAAYLSVPVKTLFSDDLINGPAYMIMIVI